MLPLLIILVLGTAIYSFIRGIEMEGIKKVNASADQLAGKLGLKAFTEAPRFMKRKSVMPRLQGKISGLPIEIVYSESKTDDGTHRSTRIWLKIPGEPVPDFSIQKDNFIEKFGRLLNKGKYLNSAQAGSRQKLVFKSEDTRFLDQVLSPEMVGRLDGLWQKKYAERIAMEKNVLRWSMSGFPVGQNAQEQLLNVLAVMESLGLNSSEFAPLAGEQQEEEDDNFF